MEVFEFTGILDIVGVNPFLFVPEEILECIFLQAGKNKGTIPVCGTVSGKTYTQTLVRFRGHWRLYINTSMLRNSPGRIGEEIRITICYDPRDRTLSMHPALKEALALNANAREVFEGLSPSRQKEIVRYIGSLKSEESVARNVGRAIGFLTGNGRFVGRDNP
jgi:Bacteriocin-protection, YdeI or OmpD-Associated/Domain of unknown function (DUF1905)